MEKTNAAGKIVLIGDLENHYQKMTAKGCNRVNVRVLGKVLKLIPKQSICSYITKNPNSSQRNFWETMVSQTEKKAEFDNIYGIILYQNELFIIEADQLMMQYYIKEGSVYFFIGELEEVMKEVVSIE